MAADIGLDHTRIHGEALATHRAFGHAAFQNLLEQLPKGVTVPEAAVSVLGEGGMVGHLVGQAQAAEPAIRQVEVHFLTQPAFRTDAKAVADDQHTDHQFRINGKPPGRAIERREMSTEITQI